MNYEMQTALEQLENSLYDVKSAQEQVSAVANSYSQLQVEIKQYSDTLNSISGSLSSVIATVKDLHQQELDGLNSALETLQTQSSAIVNEVKLLLSSTANGFKAESEQVSSNLASQVSKLESSVDNLSNLHTKVGEAVVSIAKLKEEISKLQSDLTTSQKAQDDAIASIDNMQKAVAQQLTNTDDTVNGISNILATHGNSLSQLEQSLMSISSSLVKLSTALQNMHDTLVMHVNKVQSQLVHHVDNAQSQLTQCVSSVEQTLASKNDELSKKVGTLQTLLIVQLIISIATIVIVFTLR